MASAKTIRLGWRTVSSSLSTDIFHPVTGFMPAAGFGNSRAWCEMRGRYGNALVVPAFQLANDPRSPDAAVAIPMLGGQTGYANADGVFDVASSLLPIDTTGKQLIRFGWIIKLASGTNGGASVQGGIQVYF